MPAKPLVIPVPPHPLIALALALLGAVLLALLPLSQVTATHGKKAATIGAALVAGTIAFFAADSKTIWKFVGFQDQTPLRPQSYFLLGIAISAIGVRPLIEKITGGKPISSLTPEQVRDQVVGLLSGDTVRAPFRDEVRSMLFDSEYVRAHPEIVGRLDTALADAKLALGLPEGLADHLAPRLDHIYAAAHRRDYHVKIKASLEPEKRQMAWQHSIYYEYIPRRSSAEPEITLRHAAEIPPLLLRESVANLTSFGTVFQSLRLSVQKKQGGDRLEYESKGTTLQQKQAPGGSTAAREHSGAIRIRHCARRHCDWF
ncbi:MAG TPA: hypothetical protein VGQ46_11265 [Thermoanaerobaculia bacterium]|nr:hypothetical protein [Thermoanaerobaculia bacterium]